MTPFYVALGGALGALARYATQQWIGYTSGTFPWATFAINFSGSLLLGFLLRFLPGHGAEAELRALLAVGFCGAFTTFSTFGFETVELLRRGAYLTASAYVGASVLFALAGVVGGFSLAGKLS